MLRVLLCCGLLFSGNLLAKEIPALLDWQQRMELGTLLDGMVSKVNVGIGQQVNRGSLLIELDQREIQARLAWAESRVAAAKLQQDEARRELDRSLELYDRTLLSNHERILAEIEAASVVRERNYVGVQSVPIDQIRGSEGRSADFDRDFCPLQDRTRGRWLGIARARQAGKSLPPVLLVQVGKVYYVRDGHHRISVARALGQRTIEAKVTVWNVSERAVRDRRQSLWTSSMQI